MMAARLYHNMARVHYNALEEKSGRFGRRIVYGGTCHEPGARAIVQRTSELLPYLRHKRRAPCCAAVRGPYRVCLVAHQGQGETQRAG